jgi:hypothetical protein
LPLLQYTVHPNEHWNAERGEWENVPSPVYTLRVVPDGVLDRLRQLAARLAQAYRWHVADAIAFILVDDAPISPSLSITVEWCERVPALSRIVLMVDPTMPPDELKAKYQEVRQPIVDDRFPRRLDPKTMQLAAEMAGRTATSSLAELMAEWNSSANWLAGLFGQDWTYKDKEAFGRDRRRAEQAVLRLGYRRPTADTTQTIHTAQSAEAGREGTTYEE